MERTIDWVPECFKSKAKKNAESVVLYEGHVRVRIPTNDERCEILADAGMMDEEDAEELVKKVKESGARDNVKMLLKIFRDHKHLIQSAKVKRLSDGKELSAADLPYEDGLFGIPMDFALMMIRGFGPGNG